MSNITREQLRERAREKVKSLEFAVTQSAFADTRAELEEELELARIALASLEAEPVGFIARHKETGKFGSYLHPKADWFKNDEYEVLSAYTAPPAPVAVPDEIESTSGSDYDDYYCDGWNACRAAMLQGADGNSPVIPGCSCRACRPVTMTDMRFVVCPDCGNKRCPHANDHRNACTGSNEPGQEGSAYPAAPQQEA